MSMVDVIEAIERQLTTNLAALTPPQDPPQFSFGKSDLGIQDSPPRIGWVPMTGPIRGPSGLGGDGVKFPRPLRGRALAWEAHVWIKAATVDGDGDDDGTGNGARDDMRACEAMCEHLIAAIHDVCSAGGYDMTTEGWLTGAAETNKLGVVCVVGFIIKAPYAREAEIQRTVTALPITPEIVAQT